MVSSSSNYDSTYIIINLKDNKINDNLTDVLEQTDVLEGTQTYIHIIGINNPTRVML